VLFCDVTGSTEMGERLDAESVRALMLRYFDEMRTAIERHGGTVEKFIGDAVAAVFGIPLAHEDDALRALLAATEMHDRLNLLNEELERRFGRRLAIRIGVNTGEVIAGAASGDSPLASGDAVNVAQRLQAAAKPGETLIGERTHVLTRGAAWAEPVGPLTLKGKSQAVSAYRLRSVVTGARAFARHLDAELVGRTTELQALNQEFEKCVATGRAHLVALVGEPGVGKSRLAAEFVRSIVGSAGVLTGRCLSYGEGITYWPLVEAVGEAAGIRSEDPPEEAQARIEKLLATEPDATDVAELLAAAAGLNNARASPEEIAWAARKLLRTLAHDRPIVLLLDDLQWAESTFLELVETLPAVDAPVLLLALGRPDLLERPWNPHHEDRLVVSLRPLSEDESNGLLDRVVGGALPDALRVRLTEAAGGNPLFLEELFAMLIDVGVLEFANDRWVARADVSRIPVPLTLEALLSSRLDLLDDAQRTVMECASVEGKAFHREAVEVLSPTSRRSDVESALRALSDKELIRPLVSEGPGVYAFHHLVIRDVVYRSIPKRRRAELHEAYATLLARAARRPPTGLEELLAYHLEQAVLYRRELGPPNDADIALAKTTAALLEKAAQKALARSDLFASTNQLKRAVALLSEDDPVRAELLPDLGEALTEAGELGDAERILADALARAALTGNKRLRARALVEQLVLRLQIDVPGGMSEVRSVADGARAVFERDGDELGLCRVSYLEGLVSWFQGRSAAAEEAWGDAAAHARRTGDERRLWEILSWLPSAALFGPTPATEGIRRCEELREEVRGQRRAEAEIAPQLAGLYAMTGRFELATELVDESEALLADLGFTIHSVPEWAAFVSMLAGDPHDAEQRLRAGYERLVEMGEIAHLSTTAALLARALHEQDDGDEAFAFTRESERVAAPEDVVTQIVWRGVRAKILADRGDLAEAEALGREAVALAGRTDFLSDHGDALFDLAYVLRAGNRFAETRSTSQQALGLYEQKGNVVSAEKARSLLAELAAV
jgi:class 3 adenylate cyclase/tetratricopeptide (TPR) repeat protein